MFKILTALFQIALVVAVLLFGVGIDEQLEGLVEADRRQTA